MRKLRDIMRAEGLHRLLCRMIALYIRFVFATGRWQVEGGDIPCRLHAAGRPFILAFWHGRLLMMPMAWDPNVRIHMLISAHRDGRIIARAVRPFGIRSIAGSTTRGGSSAVRAMVKALRSGDCVGITPDGPHGPARQASSGAVATARLAGVPIVPLSYASRHRRVLATWDRFQIALPFTRGVFVWGEPIEVPPTGELEPCRHELEARLNAIGERADRMVRSRCAGALPLASGSGG